MQLGMLKVTDEGSVEGVVGFIVIFRKNSEVNQFGRNS